MFPNGAELGMLTNIKAKDVVRTRAPKAMMGFLPQITVLGPRYPKSVPPEEKKKYLFRRYRIKIKYVHKLLVCHFENHTYEHKIPTIENDK